MPIIQKIKQKTKNISVKKKKKRFQHVAISKHYFQC